MTDQTMPPAGWYPAPHAGGEQRYWDGSQWMEPAPETNAPVGVQPPKKRSIKWWGWVLIGVGALFVLGLIAGALNAVGKGLPNTEPMISAPTTSATPIPTTEPVPSATPTPTPTTVPTTVPPAPAFTAGQQNAIGKAQSYLQVAPFSRDGLIKQLEFDKFSTDDATFAVDHITVDWNAQATAKAKSYLQITSFSHQGLVDQLVFDGFTQDQAEFGVTAAGL